MNWKKALPLIKELDLVELNLVGAFKDALAGNRQAQKYLIMFVIPDLPCRPEESRAEMATDVFDN